jgi:predicted nuclease of restriction endonuclease-like RecB superfamily
MLTREHTLAEYDFERRRVVPDRLTRNLHRQYVQYAERMLRVYGQGIGKTRRELHQSVWGIFAREPDCPTRRIEAFCKLLDDASTFQHDPKGRAAALRRQVFHLAAPMHPLVRRADRLFGHGEAEVKAAIAAQLGRTWDEIDRELFADVVEFHRLARFEGYADAAALLARYNVAQVQAALYDAVSLIVWASDDFKTILRYAKLARLMHAVGQTGPGQYAIRLDGPASVLRSTRRYGAAMARFVPALLACRGWRMRAEIVPGRARRPLHLDLAAEDGLTSHLPRPEEFDSQVEEGFANRWGPEKREGWTLVREGEILVRGQKAFCPDFTFRHDDGRVVLLEIVGFWTPQYLQAKRATLAAFADHRLLLALAEPIVAQWGEAASDAIVFKSSLSVQDVLDRLKASDSWVARP